ncbi:MAG: helix-turn-helix transcriptional regulator [Vicinamibacterales bacterium]
MPPRPSRLTPTSSGLPEVGFVRLPQILKVLPIGKSTFWAGVKTGRFPQPTKLGSRISVWRVEDIRRLLAKIADHEAA